MTYVEYEYYKNQYNGSEIAQEDFPRMAARATEYIDGYTMNRCRYYGDNDLIKKCCCAVAEALYTEEKGGPVLRETLGSYTVEYVNGVSISSPPNERVYQIMSRYLAGTGLLYRGI